MGSSNSKKVDSAGEVVNNITVSDKVEVQNLELLVLLYILVSLKVLELVYKIYKGHKKSLKKRYSPSADTKGKF